MSSSTSNQAIFSLNTILSLVLISIGIVVMVVLCLVTISAPCVSNFYNLMPVYPDAELIEQQSSTLNWIAIGKLEFRYHSEDELETVRAWYREAVEEARALATRAQLQGETIPKTWDHEYILSASNSGTEIRLVANCLN